jgi:hypothetical protein
MVSVASPVYRPRPRREEDGEDDIPWTRPANPAFNAVYTPQTPIGQTPANDASPTAAAPSKLASVNGAQVQEAPAKTGASEAKPADKRVRAARPRKSNELPPPAPAGQAAKPAAAAKTAPSETVAKPRRRKLAADKTEAGAPVADKPAAGKA